MASPSVPNVFDISAAPRGINPIEIGGGWEHLPFEVEDDGLGCLKGLAVAMLLNGMFALVVYGGWMVWKHLR